jgi:hypothetical protein
MGDNMFHTGPSPARFAGGLSALRALRVRHAPPLPHARFARALAGFAGRGDPAAAAALRKQLSFKSRFPPASIFCAVR